MAHNDDTSIQGSFLRKQAGTIPQVNRQLARKDVRLKKASQENFSVLVGFIVNCS